MRKQRTARSLYAPAALAHIHSMQRAGLMVTRCLHWFAQIIVDFSATWCGPCRLISPYFDELSAQYPGIIFLKVDVDAVDVRSLLRVQGTYVAGFEQQMFVFWPLQLLSNARSFTGCFAA